MGSETEYAFVGIAALAILGATIAAGFFFRGKSKRFSGRYKIYFRHQSLEGLSDRSEVKMLGNRVGMVTSLRASTWHPGAVEAYIRVSSDAAVRESTQAIIERNPATGLASITLVTPTNSSPLLTQAVTPEVYPVINEGAASG